MVIAVVTGSRSEWGLLKPLVAELVNHHNVTVLGVGSHTSPEFGLTEWLVDAELPDSAGLICFETLLSSDSTCGVTKSSALTLLSLADRFRKSRPDLVVLLGDRSEILAAATVAFDARIPIAHIHGGEETAGSQDNVRRHCITLMASYHFAATEWAAQRIADMRETALRVDGGVWHVGSLGFDGLPEPKVEKGKRLLLLYHPVTNLEDDGMEHLENLLRSLPDAVDVIGSNSDQSGRMINERLSQWVENIQWNRRGISIPSFRAHMSRAEFLRVLNSAKAIVGNSSAGIIEAPALFTPTINVGPRQQGRECAASVINAAGSEESIHAAFDVLHSPEFQLRLKGGDWPRPYGGGGAVGRITDAIREL